MKKDEKDYRDVCLEATDQFMALASRLVGNAVNRGVSYRLACHAVKVAIYQGLFGATLQTLKNDGDMPSNLKMDEAFSNFEDHEYVGHKIMELIINHLQVLDQRHVWSMNVARRELRKGEKIQFPFPPL